jgi:thioredoxin-like negative regulator of GroEL
MYSSLSSYSGFYNEPNVEHFEDTLPIVIPELTDSTLPVVFKKPTVLLVYAPWCLHCNQFKPKFIDLARECKSTSPTVSFAQLDATAWPLGASQFTIHGYPTIFLLRDGNIHTYQGVRSLPLLVSWIKSLS